MDKKFLGFAVNLFISQKGIDKRESKEKLTLELDGVCDDKFRGKDIQRSILLVSLISYKLAKQNGIEISYGELGENILVDFDPYSFEAGDKLEIGDVVIEITKLSSLCSSLPKIDSKLPKLLKDKRGIFAKVINNGSINQGDRISLIN